MPRDATGKYTLPAGNPVVTQTLITSNWANTTLSDIAAALTDTVSLQYGGTVTGNVTFNGTTTLSGTTNAVKKTGDTMTGALTIAPSSAVDASLTLNSTSPAIARLFMQNGGVGPNMLYNGQWGWTNKANNQICMTLTDTGTLTVLGNFGCSAISCIGLTSTADIVAANPNSSVAGQIRVQNPSGTSFYMRGRAAGSGAGIEFVNNAYNNVVAYILDNGNIGSINNLSAGSANYQTDGNITGASIWGGALSTYLTNNFNGKAANQAQVQWGSSINEWGTITQGASGSGTVDIGAPWVMEGLRANAWANYLRGVWLRNA